MKRSIYITLLMSLFVFPLAGSAQYHYKLGPDWTVGNGVWVVVDEVEFFGNDARNNRVLVSTNIDNPDWLPVHAWINKDFGTDYTVKCDVRMESWIEPDAEELPMDLSRGGVAVRLKPAGSNESTNAKDDRAINMLFHHDFDTIEYLNDYRAWANTNDGEFTWEKGVMYTFELAVAGNQVTGKIYKTEDGPNNAFELKPWTDASFADRAAGFPGLTGSNTDGITTVFDNFEVIAGGNVVFSDDFEGGLERIPQTAGLSDKWVFGEGGYWVVSNGVLYGIATSRLDPKKIWYKEEIAGGASIKADVKMISWHGGVYLPGNNWQGDLSRSGVSLHIQPEGRGGGRAPSDRGPGEARGIVMLLHDNTQTVEFLNDFVAWANLDDNTIPWTIGNWYTFEMRSDGFTVEGTFTDRSDPANTVEMTPWTFPGIQDRFDGFAGLGASTVSGEVAAFDNVEIRDENGNLLFADDFETFVGVHEWAVY
ncbi:MAG: hypothetical protein AB1656_09955 [Candidatus Omnitrophota bacterium]